MLKRCSDKKDMTEWNEWRKENPNEDILLEGADLKRCWLRDVRLDTGGSSPFSGIVHLKGVKLREAYLESAHLHRSQLKDADLWGVDLECADLTTSFLEGANLRGVNLKGANLRKANLKGACFEMAVVDVFTLFRQCKVNPHTDFRDVALDCARIESGTKQLLEHNVRRMRWGNWYKWNDWDMDDPKDQRKKLHQLLRLPVCWFWSLSDYGLSTGRIVAVFLGFVIVFAAIYYVLGLIAPPGIVDYLFVDANGVKVGTGLALVRAVHFSVVIMTVGFTNMHASAHSFWAHVLVGFQMILGFVLLGALVTRFAVLFTAGGPAGKFAQENE